MSHNLVIVDGAATPAAIELLSRKWGSHTRLMYECPSRRGLPEGAHPVFRPAIRSVPPDSTRALSAVQGYFWHIPVSYLTFTTFHGIP